MQRDAHDRDDLMAEASALVERVCIVAAGEENPSVVGFRPDGSASFYFSADRVYQFTSAGQLRRAFADDLLFKAERQQLISLRRERDEARVALVRHELNAEETRAFLAEMSSRLDALHHALAKGKFKVVAQVPEEADLVSRICCWLDEFGHENEIAASPRAC